MLCVLYARTRLRVEMGETFCIKQLAQLGTCFAEAVPEGIAVSNESLSFGITSQNELCKDPKATMC